MRILGAGPVSAAIGSACLVAAIGLASLHVLSPAVAVVGVLVAAGLAFRQPLWALALPLALLPIASLAPWTGSMLVEEFDLLLLALLAGAWWQRAMAARPSQRPVDVPDLGVRFGVLLAVAYAMSAAWSTYRGLIDAGAWRDDGFAWGLWPGWREPMNVLRTIKPLLWAALALPVWMHLQRLHPQRASVMVAFGAWGGLLIVSCLATWERFAWTGLTNFNTDYRTTALFWETHVGGAALDGFLALTLPFGIWALVRARRPLQTWLAVGALALAGYAIVTTFSRGLYLGAVVGLVLLAWRIAKGPQDRANAWRGTGWALLFAFAAAVVFPVGGWRGVGAIWGLVAMAFFAWQRNVLPGLQSTRLLGVVALGVLVGMAATAAALAVPKAWKAPYLLYSLLGALCLWAWWRQGNGARVQAGLAAWLATAVATFGIVVHWGRDGDVVLAGIGVAVVAATVCLGVRRAAWRGPPGGHWRIASLAAMAVIATAVGSLLGGRYLEGRLASVHDDWTGRTAHWTRSLALADGEGTAWWGLGPGRFASHFAFSGETTDQTGDFRWQRNPAGGELILTGGKHVLGFGEVFRMSQRIGQPVGDVTVTWRSRADPGTQLHMEICSKHLLYESGCTSTKVLASPSSSSDGAGAARTGWHTGQATLPALPRVHQPVFSVAVYARGARVSVDELHAVDAQGQVLLRNPGFDDGLKHWLPSSDRHHLPWHAKNLGIHLKVEQGWVGLGLLALLVAWAIGRLAVGATRRHPLAPVLLAALAGFLVVGAFDSLLDIPRVAFAFYWLLGVAASLRPSEPSHGRPSEVGRRSE